MTSAATGRSEPKTPRASVVMVVHGDLRFLDAAIESVLDQDMADLELILVDDGDGSPAIAAAAGRDARIRFLRLETNLGAGEAGNRGVALARSDIVARLDADDRAEPGWLGRVVAALEADPGLAVVGAAVTLVDEAGDALGVEPMPETDLAIRWTMLFHNPFYHPTTAFRRSRFEAVGGYPAAEPVSHDHFLWFALLARGRGANLAEPLVRYRLNPRGLTAGRMAHNPRRATHSIREALWREIGLDYRLRDDATAREVSEFLRGRPAPESARRGPAYGELLRGLGAFLRVHGRRDRAAARQLARGLFERMRDNPPPGKAWPSRLFLAQTRLRLEGLA